MPRLPRLAAATALSLALCLPAATRADEVLDTIDAARAAFETGNVQATLDELAYAQQLVREIQAAELAAFLPEAPEGWSRNIRTDMGAALAMFGGGVGAEATYATGSQSFSITLMADNAMVQALAGMLGEAGLPEGAGRLIVGGETFLDQSGELTGLIDGRILIQASGAPSEVMVPVLETIDFAAMRANGG